MMEDYINEQALMDAGCSKQIRMQCLQLIKTEQICELLRLLKKQRVCLLNAVHEKQQRLECLDYLLYQIKKTYEEEHK